MLENLAKRWLRGKRHSELKRSLEQARMMTTPEDYAKVVMAGTIAGGAAGAIIGLLLPIILLTDPPLTLTLVSPILSGAALAGATYMGILGYPSLHAGSMSSEIDTYLSKSTAYLYALSSGGVGLLECIRSLSERTGEFGKVAEEMRLVMHEVEYKGADMRSAIIKVAGTTPSKKLRRLLESLAGVVQMGGSVAEFFYARYRELNDEMVRRQKSVLETLGIFAELYVIVFVVAPILILTTSVVGSMIGAFSAMQIGVIVIGGFPLITVGLLTGLNAITKSLPKGRIGTASSRKRAARKKESRLRVLWSLISREPIYITAFSLPAAMVYLIAMFVLCGVMGSLELLLAFCIAVLPFIVLYESRERRISRIEERVPDFLRELASASAAGLPLPRAIKAISTEHLGAIGPYVKRMQNDLEWGMPVSEALIRFAAETQSTEVWRAAVLIQKTSESGGDTARVANIMEDEIVASQNMERDRRSNMMTYLITVWIGFAVLLVTVYFINTSIFAYVSPTVGLTGAETGIIFNPRETTDMFFATTTVLGVCSGLIAGSLGSGKVPSGVKHSLILVVMTYLAFTFLIYPSLPSTF